MRSPFDPENTEHLCEALVRHLEISGSEMFEKNFEKDGKTLCTVMCIIGPNADEITRRMRDMLSELGFKRDY